MTEKENIQNETQKDDTIRNVDMAEYVKKKKEEMTLAEQDQSEETINETEAEEEIQMLKKSTSKFEPEPFKVHLPSDGMTINPKLMDEPGYIYIRRTTTKEEDWIYDFINTLISTNNESMGLMTQEMIIMIDRVIDSCLKTNIPVSELMVIDREVLFNDIIALGYGREQKVPHKCIGCDTDYEVKIDLINDIKVNYLKNSKLAFPKTIKLTSYKDIAVDIRHLKMGETHLMFNKNAKQTDIFNTVCVKAYNIKTGEEFVGQEKYDLLENLNNDDRKAIKEYLDDFAKLGTSFEFEKKVCTNPDCRLHNKKVVGNYSLYFLFFNVIKIKNVIV